MTIHDTDYYKINNSVFNVLNLESIPKSPKEEKCHQYTKALIPIAIGITNNSISAFNRPFI
jgi:hypothetical protein